MPDRNKLLQDIKGDITPDQYRRLQEMLSQKMIEKPREKLNRIPFLLPLLGTFGLVSTFYGFEKFLDTTELVNHPFELIAFGVVILLLTGAAATKL